MAAILNHVQGKWVTDFRLFFDATAVRTTWDKQITARGKSNCQVVKPKQQTLRDEIQ